MILLDVNVVLAAHRADHPQHASVRPWLDGIIGERRPFSVPDIVWAGFIRISTSRRIFSVPTPLPEAFAYLRSIRDQPSHFALTPGPMHLALFERVCHESDALGDLVPDAYLAALAIEQGAALASLDRDFARFEQLRWERPARAPA